ncbi:type I restriction enzyme HsdR N-terminal domain-containing protein [Alistipes sp.]|uniref:type I restriction enzyme HsdR N-terminal domain-containing protein n=1 Tax=Alistipes sp. TaxID=1872444 RepID=UPI0025C14EF0|nr:type I restriction enzyme HsdR N-terminal domain-containing protein [Alistipes sp.]
MSGLPKLNFPAIRLRARRRGDDVEVWDSLRGIYLVLTPEEWVRQHLIAYLTADCGVQPKRIVQEYAVALNGQPQRADVVVVGDRAEPLLLAECKAPSVAINERTLAQAVRYNSVLRARYVVLTNGLRHYCYEYRDGAYAQLGGFPDLSGE